MLPASGSIRLYPLNIPLFDVARAMDGDDVALPAVDAGEDDSPVRRDRRRGFGYGSGGGRKRTGRIDVIRGMIASLRFGRTLAPVIMLMAAVASFAGPSLVSTIGLLDGDAGTAAAAETHLPIDMAAAPDQFTEAAGPTFGFEGPVRIIPVIYNPATRPGTARPVCAIRGSGGVRAPSVHTLLCVYRL